MRLKGEAVHRHQELQIQFPSRPSRGTVPPHGKPRYLYLIYGLVFSTLLTHGFFGARFSFTPEF